MNRPELFSILGGAVLVEVQVDAARLKVLNCAQ